MISVSRQQHSEIFINWTILENNWYRAKISCWGRCQGDNRMWCCCLHVKVDGRWMTSYSREIMRYVENVGRECDTHSDNILTDSTIYACLKSYSRDLQPSWHLRFKHLCMFSDYGCKLAQQRVVFCRRTCWSKISVRCLKYERNGSYTVVAYFRLQCKSSLAAVCNGTLQHCAVLHIEYILFRPEYRTQDVDVAHGTVFLCCAVKVPFWYISLSKQRKRRSALICRVNLLTKLIRITSLLWKSRRKMKDRLGIATKMLSNFKHCLSLKVCCVFLCLIKSDFECFTALLDKILFSEL